MSSKVTVPDTAYLSKRSTVKQKNKHKNKRLVFSKNKNVSFKPSKKVKAKENVEIVHVPKIDVNDSNINARLDEIKWIMDPNFYVNNKIDFKLMEKELGVSYTKELFRQILKHEHGTCYLRVKGLLADVNSYITTK